MKKYKVALIHNIISPYRVPLFEGLSEHPFIDLFVYFCAKTHKERQWSIPQSNKYNYEILSGVTLEFLGIIYHINPSIILKLIKEKYDVIIIGGGTDFTTQAAFITSHLLKTPMILWSEGTSGTQSLLGKIISPITRYITRHATACIAASTSAKDFFIANGACPEKVFIPPNTVDTEFLKKESLEYSMRKNELKRKLGVKNDKIILYVGQLIRRKGIGYLLFGYKKLKEEYADVGLAVVGSGPLKEELMKICQTENIKDVYFFGFVQQKELPMYYSLADLFVLPSLRETFGLVINEAMACGLPVITTKAVGARDLIIQRESGFIVDEANADQLYLAMREITSNEELSSKMGEKSLEIVEREYNIEQAVKGFVSAIEYACMNKK
jgi:glycosyltransferase involved in cell wall biosynthesis